MRVNERLLLLCGGVLTGVAALLHIGIIAGGPAWYRFFGAGERMARLAAHGSPAPALVTAGIAAVLATWMLYALSGAGVIRYRLLFQRAALPAISMVFLLRGVAAVPVILLVDTTFTRELRPRMLSMGVSSEPLHRALLRRRRGSVRRRPVGGPIVPRMSMHPFLPFESMPVTVSERTDNGARI